MSRVRQVTTFQTDKTKKLLGLEKNTHMKFEERVDSGLEGPIYENEDTLGDCGCVDYHMADCPVRTYIESAYDVGPQLGIENDNRQ